MQLPKLICLMTFHMNSITIYTSMHAIECYHQYRYYVRFIINYKCFQLATGEHFFTEIFHDKGATSMNIFKNHACNSARPMVYLYFQSYSSVNGIVLNYPFRI